MKGLLDRTKVVVRHLPPTFSQSSLVEYVDSRFSGRYQWLSFRPGKSNHKHMRHSRAYIDFNRPEDVVEFAEFFNGHVFVNEKGAQFKSVVQYAPSQRVPKQWSKKDGREGMIFKDSEYLEFLEFLSKPVENLPSAEIQLERKKAELAVALKEVPIVTPLMAYVRQKRAAKLLELNTSNDEMHIGSQRKRPLCIITKRIMNGKSTRRLGGISSRSTGLGSSKSGSERSFVPMYVLQDNSKGVPNKYKSTCLLVEKQDDQQVKNKFEGLAVVSGIDALDEEIGSNGSGKKKILLLKGKEKEILDLSGDPSLQPDSSSPSKSQQGSAPSRRIQRHESSGRIIRSILLKRDTHQNHLIPVSQPEFRIRTSNQGRDRKPPRPPSMHSIQKEFAGASADKIVNNDSHAVHTEKWEGRTRNKDKQDRVWTLRRSNGLHTSDESLSSFAQTSQVEGSTEGFKSEMPASRGAEHMYSGSGRSNHYPVDNGAYSHGGRRGSAYNSKDTDGSSVVEGKALRRGVSSGYGSHEKQVWVQKTT